MRYARDIGGEAPGQGPEQEPSTALPGETSPRSGSYQAAWTRGERWHQMGEDSALQTENGIADPGEQEQDAAEASEDADSSDEEAFFLDPEGRVPFAGEMDFDFKSAPKALESALSEPGALARAVADCQAVFSARAKTLEYSTGETFWVPAIAQPRNSLEALALDIFNAHTVGARFNRTTSGAEWWTQVIDDADDIGWHWDKDYGMEAQGINVHPCLATVTYLSENGGPTVVLEKRGPMACQDVTAVTGSAPRAWFSRPRLGKHICFDGRFLHAAPADLASDDVPRKPILSEPNIDLDANGGSRPAAEGSVSGEDTHQGGTKRAIDGKPKDISNAGASSRAPMKAAQGNGKGSARKAVASGRGEATRRRVTFLVNVWLNHTPKTAALLPEETARALSSAKLDCKLSVGDFEAPAFFRVGTTDCGGGAGGGTGASPARCCDRRARNPDVACRETNAREELFAIDRRYEFGEVGDEAQEQVHLRHEVMVPVPTAVMALREARSGGDVFCVEYPGSRKPEVKRVACGNSSEAYSSSDSGGEGDEEEEEFVHEEEEEEE